MFMFACVNSGAHVDKDPVANSRSSTPLDENADRGMDAYRGVHRDIDRSTVPCPRCQDYDGMFN